MEGLLEREDELAVLVSAVDAARTGQGALAARMLALSTPAGIEEYVRALAEPAR
jgi:hypothetical protein